MAWGSLRAVGRVGGTWRAGGDACEVCGEEGGAEFAAGDAAAHHQWQPAVDPRTCGSARADAHALRLLVAVCRFSTGMYLSLGPALGLKVTHLC